MVFVSSIIGGDAPLAPSDDGVLVAVSAFAVWPGTSDGGSVDCSEISGCESGGEVSAPTLVSGEVGVPAPSGVGIAGSEDEPS